MDTPIAYHDWLEFDGQASHCVLVWRGVVKHCQKIEKRVF